MAIGNGTGDIWSNAGDTESPEGVLVNAGYITDGILSLSSGDEEVQKYYNLSTAGIYYKHIVPPIGLTWTEYTSPDDAWCVAYGDGKFVALDQYQSYSLTSTNGVDWTVNSSVIDSRWWKDCKYLNNQFIAAGGYGVGTNRISTSPDGLVWTPRSLPSDRNWESVAYGNGIYVAVSSTDISDCVIYSDDNGATWKLANSAPARYVYDVEFGNGVFVITHSGDSSDPQRLSTSTDGNSWTLRSIDTTGLSTSQYPLYSIAHTNSRFIAVANNNVANVQYSSDGINWTVGTVDNAISNIKLLDNSRFIGFIGSTAYITEDGVTWNSNSIGSSTYIDYVSNDTFTKGVLVGTNGYFAVT